MALIIKGNKGRPNLNRRVKKNPSSAAAHETSLGAVLRDMVNELGLNSAPPSRAFPQIKSGPTLDSLMKEFVKENSKKLDAFIRTPFKLEKPPKRFSPS